MIPFVDSYTTHSDDVEMVTADGSVGILHGLRSQEIRGDVYFDIGRLRRAILAYEYEFDSSEVELAICEHEDSGFPVLALVPEDVDGRAILLASRIHGSDHEPRTGADELVTADGGESA